VRGLTARVFGVLDRRLETGTGAPLGVALSGGGDSLALLDLACAWAGPRGRRVVAFTVDHGLNADSTSWTAFARRAAERLGADWRGLAWEDAKPSAGLPAAARAARHRLIAEAAREAGCRVVLFGHTADDAEEGERMRSEGAPLGRVREWSPSPAWPEGRGVFLLRPMLDVSRAELRARLTARGLDWIDDPANEDVRYARARVRARFAPPTDSGFSSAHPREGGDPETLTPGAETSLRPPLYFEGLGPRLRGDERDTDRGAFFTFPRPALADPRLLSAALLCASGGDRPARGERLERLRLRLQSAETFTATLSGARVEAGAETVLVARDAGEAARGGLAPLPLSPGVPAVWDGRFEITTDEPGWTVLPLKGLFAQLGHADRRVVLALPAAVRPGLPVLAREGGAGPVPAWRAARVESLAARRLAAACGVIAHEREIGVPPRGEGTDGALCWSLTWSEARTRTGRGLNEPA